MLKELVLYIEYYLLTYEYQCYHDFYQNDKHISVKIKYSTWNISIYDIGEKLSSTYIEHTHCFYSVAKDGV
ncbi:Hypotetical protein [Plasmodium sp. gorilla clade G2]|uniref:Hypotetical protein n=1 Tax=Plasmodium sp. gorilla clade G2 TaxID=880535 RepID=UPI000D2E7325|nr:Hypotetical protein [Plasmodium sp. gorilla clade G2]SOV20233.1 Hypotetical protein [Plasmodium sp. gorilla clade G2]